MLSVLVKYICPLLLSILIKSELKDKVLSELSDIVNILSYVPQGSILVPILFILFLADLFFINNDIDFVSYVDDTIPYGSGKNFSEVIYAF